MKEKMLNIINRIKLEWEENAIIWQVLFAVFGVLLFCMGFYSNLKIMIFSLFCLMISLAIFCLRDFNKRIILLLFESTFFLFLVGKIFFEFGKIKEGIRNFDFNTSCHIVILLVSAIIFLYLGYLVSEKILEKQNKIKNESKGKISKINPFLQKYAKIFFILGFIVNILLTGEKIIYVFTKSYLEFVREFDSIFPNYLRYLANMRNVSFFIYLATFPNKKECKKILILYFIEAITTLGYGDRGNFALNIVFIVFYVVLRQFNNPKEEWINYKQIIIFICIIPFLFAFLSFFISLREKGETDIGNKNFSTQIVRFFLSIGDSIKVLGYGKQYEDKIPDDRIYSIGDIVQYIKYNPICCKIFGYDEPKYYTKEYAQNTHSFAHMISYVSKPDLYLDGHGQGSAYLAELYQDFGYIGVIIFNYLLGAYMAIFNKIYKVNSLFTAMMFLSFYVMFFMPRAAVDYMITYVFNLTAIATTTIIVGVSFIEYKIQIERKKLIE